MSTNDATRRPGDLGPTVSELRGALGTLQQDADDVDRAWEDHTGRFDSASRSRFGRRPLSELSLPRVLTFAAVVALLAAFVAFGSFEVTKSSGNPKPLTSAKHGGLAIQVTLATTQAVAGTRVKGELVVNNPGRTLNLTALQTGPNKGCQPAWLVYLENSKVNQGGSFGIPCSSAPFLIRHGLTRLPFTVLTTYSGCGQTATAFSPKCLKSGPPPLPPGKYFAKLLWSSNVPLPSARPATVTLLPGASNELISCPIGTVTVPVTTTKVVPVCLRVGSELKVSIGPDMTSGHWITPPRAEDPAILHLLSSGTSGSTLTAFFKAESTGSTTVTATFGASMTGCTPTPCTPIPDVPLAIDVTVVSGNRKS